MRPILVFVLGVASLFGIRSATAVVESEAAVLSALVAGPPKGYVLIAWNDLGMHCISPRYGEMAILPPYNNLRAIVIRQGHEPRIVSSNLTLRYSLNNNQSVEGKTNFWRYVRYLFGKRIAPGIGLAGKGLSGAMEAPQDIFQANGVPVLPFDDSMTWNPYQRATISLYVGGYTKPSATASIVVPVSDEMNCIICHANGKVAAKKMKNKTLEQNILTLHDLREKTTLMDSRPVLCASCHADAALGTVGKTNVASLSYAMHVKHASLAAQPACYDCHPGARTQCNRSAAPEMGAVTKNGVVNPRCSNCHGDLNRMAASLRAGRRPWVEEPTCAQCHGQRYSTGRLLYREARGHGGVPCVACHNSPHAWYPSSRDDDNYQVRLLQGNTHAIGYKACYVCHTDGRTGTIPPHEED